MRRPILGNGIPRNILNADGYVTILDTTALDPKQTYALTLFLWWYGVEGTGIVAPTVEVAVSTNGGAEQLVGGFPSTYLDTIWTSPAAPGAGANIRPLKVLDRYMVRGNQKVVARNINADPTSLYCYVWGYFEPMGGDDAIGPFRGLQPAVPVAPFNYPPVAYSYLAAAEQTQTQTLHQLSATHIDVLTIDAFTFVPGGYAGSAPEVSTTIVFPGGVGVTLPTTITQVPFRIFDGIPMRAPTAADVDISLLSHTPAATAAAGAAYGSFYRY